MSPYFASAGRLLSAVRALVGSRRRRKLVPRDPRHAMRAPILYRQRGGLFWYDGILEDFSLSGIRFRGEKYLPVQCPVEMSFAVPRDPNDTGKVSFFCWAKVARTALPCLADGQFGIGARILRYRSEVPTAADYRGVIGEVRGPSGKPKEDHSSRVKPV